jgi:hypothetical protein
VVQFSLVTLVNCSGEPGAAVDLGGIAGYECGKIRDEIEDHSGHVIRREGRALNHKGYEGLKGVTKAHLMDALVVPADGLCGLIPSHISEEFPLLLQD